MTQNRSNRWAILWRGLAVLLLVLLPGLSAARPAAAEGADDLDSALLLMLASHNLLYDTDALPAVSGRLVPGLAAPLPQGVPTAAQVNEHRQLAKLYDDWSWDLEKASLSQHFDRRAAEHQAKADALDRARQRAYARGKGLQRFLRRRVVRPVSQAVGWTGRGIARGGEIVLVLVRDELVSRARQIVRARLVEVRNLFQGRIDAVWHRVAARIGMPLAELIRHMVVDPAFVRVRDQLAARTGADWAIAALEMRKQETADGTTDLPADDEPTRDDDIPYDEQGDTDYDDPDEPASDDGTYDVLNWFSEENLAAECTPLLGDWAQSPANHLNYYTNDVDGGGGEEIRVVCDYRQGSDLIGAKVEIEAFSAVEFVGQARGAAWWDSYCGPDAPDYTRGELICEADGGYIELRTCAISDCQGCGPGSCDAFYILTDGNAWVSIMLTVRPEQAGDRAAEVRQIAENVRRVLAARRQGTP